MLVVRWFCACLIVDVYLLVYLKFFTALWFASSTTVGVLLWRLSFGVSILFYFYAFALLLGNSLIEKFTMNGTFSLVGQT